MAATIKATCPHCGDVSLAPDEVLLELLVPSARHQGHDRYWFTCPDCSREVRKPADERIVQLLRSGGVPVRELRPHPERMPAVASPLTRDHLLAFHEQLRDDDWLAGLCDTDPR